jgi:hypothetical protein
MPGIVSETHAVELKCEELREQIRQKYATELAGADDKTRKVMKRAMEKEMKSVVSAYLKANGPRRSSLGTLIH